MRAVGVWPITAGACQASARRFSGISPALALARELPGRPRDGQLNPIEERTGQAARLRSLGFLRHGTDTDEDLRAALRAFQFMNELDPTGEADGTTLEKLARVYGC